MDKRRGGGLTALFFPDIIYPSTETEEERNDD